MQTKFLPLQLGDIFEKIFQLTGKTFVRNLILVSIILIPASIILAFGYNSFFSHIISLIEEMEYYNEPPIERILDIVGGFFTYGIALTVFVFGSLIATLGVTITGCRFTADEPITWMEALRETFSMKFWKTLGASILQGLAIMGIFIIPYLMMIIGFASDGTPLAVFGVLSLLAAVAFMIYLSIRWAFIIPAIGYENTGAIEAFGRSSFLVKNFWWRTFGILILLNIVAQFAISVVTTPISVAVLWDIFADLISLITKNYNPEPKEIIRLFSSFGYRIGIITAISAIVQLLITPLITVILYFDLRARKNEFENPANDNPTEEAPGLI